MSLCLGTSRLLTRAVRYGREWGQIGTNDLYLGVFNIIFSLYIGSNLEILTQLLGMQTLGSQMVNCFPIKPNGLYMSFIRRIEEQP